MSRFIFEIVLMCALLNFNVLSRKRKLKAVFNITILYNYGLHENLISIIIKLRKGYFPEIRSYWFDV